jgi:hypothetical protein
MLIEFYRDFLQSPQANTGIRPYIMLQPIPSNPFQFITQYHHFIPRYIIWITERESLNKLRVKLLHFTERASLNKLQIQLLYFPKKCYIPRTNWASWTTCFISLPAFSSHILCWRNLNIDSPLRKKSCYRPLRWSLGCRSPQVGVAVTRVADHDVMIPCSLSSVSVMPHIWLNPFLVFNPSPCHTLAPFTSTAPLFLYFSSTVLCIWVGGGMKENACAVFYWPAVLILPM